MAVHTRTYSYSHTHTHTYTPSHTYTHTHIHTHFFSRKFHHSQAGSMRKGKFCCLLYVFTKKSFFFHSLNKNKFIEKMMDLWFLDQHMEIQQCLLNIDGFICQYSLKKFVYHIKLPLWRSHRKYKWFCCNISNFKWYLCKIKSKIRK